MGAWEAVMTGAFVGALLLGGLVVEISRVRRAPSCLLAYWVSWVQGCSCRWSGGSQMAECPNSAR